MTLEEILLLYIAIMLTRNTQPATNLMRFINRSWPHKRRFYNRLWQWIQARALDVQNKRTAEQIRKARNE